MHCRHFYKRKPPAESLDEFWASSIQKNINQGQLAFALASVKKSCISIHGSFTHRKDLKHFMPRNIWLYIVNCSDLINLKVCIGVDGAQLDRTLIFCVCSDSLSKDSMNTTTLRIRCIFNNKAIHNKRSIISIILERSWDCAQGIDEWPEQSQVCVQNINTFVDFRLIMIQNSFTASFLYGFSRICSKLIPVVE